MTALTYYPGPEKGRIGERQREREREREREMAMIATKLKKVGKMVIEKGIKHGIGGAYIPNRKIVTGKVSQTTWSCY